MSVVNTLFMDMIVVFSHMLMPVEMSGVAVHMCEVCVGRKSLVY